MEKVKLKFKSDFSNSDVYRVYLNPDIVPLTIEGVDFPVDLSAYNGLDYLLVPTETINEVVLFNDKGKDISSKIKNPAENWEHQAIPFSQTDITKLSKEKSSLFKKTDSEIVKKALFCNFPTVSSKVEQSIIKLLEYCQNHLEDGNEQKSLELLFRQSVSNNKKVAVGVDIFSNVSGLSLEVIFDLEMEKKIDFNNLYFLSLKSVFPHTSSGRTTMPNVIVYEDTLYFGKLRLNIPSIESSETDKISMKNFVCNGDQIIQKLSKVDEHLK